MGPNPGRERRHIARVWLDDSASARPVPQPSPLRSWRVLCEDLSEDGARLLSPECFPVGSGLLLECDIGGRATRLQVLGRVLRIEQLPEADRWKTAVEFSELSDNARIRLLEIIAEQRRRP